ncbi:Metallo-dependent phosphatase [Macroventuria anomochaeta]|uniref:Metallo-dependent phosphatase n=1 Tax=Macroventuria anomochaeta TaxID=301207 RepID=A0ACB6RNP2_9PLEO|nr:Metallo-dependent phosphatase [Macroventuria anomochaeta]KAF2623506.1 Metallo-dependent phosphatase [Macroventuria anomochaeta]
MRFSTASGAIALSALAASQAQAEDVLYSRHLAKRDLDADKNYNITFFHVNDVHAHLDEFSSSGTDCTRPERGCYGGYARIKTVVEEKRPNYNDSLWLNVGDEFQGTLFYSFYGGEKIAETLNQMNFSAMTLGNHEFDGGDEELGQFLENLTFPIISANIHSQNEKVNKSVKPYHIFEEYGLALIGVTTDETPSIANPDETTVFSDVVEAVQGAIDEIKSTTNITRIAAITHIGYEKDQELARATKGLQLIMGGHSHTLLGDMEDAEGKYPTIVDNADGDEVFIVTAYRWGEYIGSIEVTYDPQGKILSYQGAPIHITNTTEQDTDLQAQIKSWRGPFEEFAAEVLGTSEVELDQTTCQRQECLLGDFMADAMLAYRKNNTEDVDFAIINAGGIRATIDQGDITRGEVLTSFPFGNSIVQIEIDGKELWEVLEGIVTGVNVANGKEVTSFFQVSTGIKVEYNPENNNGSKLVAVTIGGHPLDNGTTYQVVTLDFIAGGGDNFFTPTADFVSLDTQDEVLTQYVLAKTPVNIELDGRIEAVDHQRNTTAGGNGTTNGTSPSGTGSPTPKSTGAAVQLGSGLVGATMFAAIAGLLML